MGRRDLVSREYGDSAAQALGRVGGFAYRRSVGRP